LLKDAYTIRNGFGGVDGTRDILGKNSNFAAVCCFNRRDNLSRQVGQDNHLRKKASKNKQSAL
jgi:hypothetical protein